MTKLLGVCYNRGVGSATPERGRFTVVKYESPREEKELMSTAPLWLLYGSKVEANADLAEWLDQNKEALDDWDKNMLDK